MGKLISIVTLDLEEEGGLQRTARSLAAQTYRSYEWLVLGGGSSEASLGTIKDFGLLVGGWWSTPPRSAWDAMNLGLARAGGDYVIFMRAGDRFASETALERVAGALVRRPQPDLLFGGTMLELSGDRWLYRPPQAPRFLRSAPPASHPATVFRRTVHLDVLYDRRLSAAADYGAVATLLQRGASWRRLDAPIAVRCCRSSQLRRHGERTRLADLVRVQRGILAMSWPAIGAGLIRLALADILRPALGRGPLPSPGSAPAAQRWVQQHARPETAS
jgi:glycosyltransferase involved in cell wall biosynthesis